MRFILILIVGLFSSLQAQAQWLDVALTYSDIKYRGPEVSTQEGRMAGVKGELGLPLFKGLSVSAGGQYQSGNLNFDGTTFGATSISQQVTKDYIRDYRVLANLQYGALTLSGGVGQRYWYNDLVTTYRRRQQYDYFPVIATLRRRGFYVKAEMDVWREGKNTTHMSDLGGVYQDVEFKQTKGGGLGAEIGILIPNAARFNSHVFVS